MFTDTHSHPKQNVQLFVSFGFLPASRHRSIRRIAAADVTCSYFRMFVKLENSEARCASEKSVFLCCIVFLRLNIKISSFPPRPTAVAGAFQLTKREVGGRKQCWPNCTTRGHHLGRYQTQTRECIKCTLIKKEKKERKKGSLPTCTFRYTEAG